MRMEPLVGGSGTVVVVHDEPENVTVIGSWRRKALETPL